MSTSPLRKGATASDASAPPTLAPQQHGGALLRGGKPGNRGGGRKPVKPRPPQSEDDKTLIRIVDDPRPQSTEPRQQTAETPVTETAALPARIEQPHGGAINAGGTPGNVGGSGPPRAAYREYCRNELERPEVQAAVRRALQNEESRSFASLHKQFAEMAYGKPDQRLDASIKNNVTAEIVHTKRYFYLPAMGSEPTEESLGPPNETYDSFAQFAATHAVVSSPNSNGHGPEVREVFNLPKPGSE
jgi:hypothetical protein